MQNATWAIVLTADEPAVLVLANVHWHLGTGATEVHVYLDRPDDPVADDLAAIKGCFVTSCDAAYWKSAAPRRQRPPTQLRRQSINANHALARSKADWMFHIDADELIWQNAPLGAELAAVAELGAELHLPVQERFYPNAVGAGIYDGAFRASTKDRKGFDPQIFGDQSDYLVCGVLGHAAGKCAVPVQDGYSLGVHWGYRGGTGRDHRLPRYGSTAARLLHFDGLTPLHWQIKLLRYAAHDLDTLKHLVPGHRQNQIAKVISGADAHALHDSLRVLDRDTTDRLTAFGLIHHHDLSAQSDFGGVDLSVRAFDTALRARYPDFAELVAG